MKRGSRWVIILVLLLMFFHMQLAATESVRIGYSLYIPNTSRGTVLYSLSSDIQRNISDYVPSEYYSQLMNDRLQAEQLRYHFTKMQRANNQDARVDTPFIYDTVEATSFAWEPLELSDAINAALASGDTIVADYVMKYHNLDVLVLSVLEPIDSLYRLRVEEFRSDTSTMRIFEEVLLSTDEEHIARPALLEILSHYSSRELGIISVTSHTPGLTLHIRNEVLAHHIQHIVLPAGTYELHASAPGRESMTYTVTLESGDIVSHEIHLPVHSGDPLLVTSYAALDVVIPQVVQAQTPVFVQEITPPFVIYTMDQGVPVQTIHVIEPIDEIQLSLQPQWIEPIYGSMRSQSSVYASIGRTLLLGGLTILLDSVSQSVASYTADMTPWQPVILVSRGALAVSLFDTGVRLFAYYQKTKYSSRY